MHSWFISWWALLMNACLQHRRPGFLTLQTCSLSAGITHLLLQMTIAFQVRLYGGCLRPPRMFVVQELLVGSLSSLIHQHRPESGLSDFEPERPNDVVTQPSHTSLLPLSYCLKLALDVAHGLAYLVGDHHVQWALSWVVWLCGTRLTCCLLGPCRLHQCTQGTVACCLLQCGPCIIVFIVLAASSVS